MSNMAAGQVVEAGEPAGPGSGPDGGAHGGTQSIDRPIEIDVNGRKYAAPKPSMTGEEIKDLAGGPPDYMLVLVVEQGDDRQVADGESVRLETGMRFRILDSATFGQDLLELPPLLSKHVGSLRQKFSVEVIRENGFCVIIKDYPVPERVWGRRGVDLLVVAPDSYPNGQMDMFWVDPPLYLEGAKAPNGTGSESKCGRTWQSFSWHVPSWKPAFDNLLTYLYVVDSRLGKAA